jgi:hypothetical protein
MSRARYLVGDVFEQLAGIPDGSIDLVLTSPPFIALRSYLPDDHPDKAKEIGQEPTPAAFIDTLLALSAEWRRVLAPHGSIAVELGDTYAGSGGAGGDYAEGGLREGQPAFSGSATKARRPTPRSRNARHPNAAPPARLRTRRRIDGWPMDKSITGIPWLYALSLVWGRNLLTGLDSPAGEWLVRNVVAWCRPNPSPGALGDKFRPATSYITVGTVSPTRYFDGDAVRVPASENSHARTAKGVATRENTTPKAGAGGNNNRDTLAIQHLNATRPLYDWWELPTHPYPGAHHATYPEALCVPLVESMAPRRVCQECGEPSRRIVETKSTGQNTRKSRGSADDPRQRGAVSSTEVPEYAERVTLGWTDCGHDAWRPGLVLDPFAGSGTTLAVATARGRDAIGIDLDARNVDLARQRIGMFLDLDGAA